MKIFQSKKPAVMGSLLSFSFWKYKYKWLFIIVISLAIYLVWGYLGFAGARIPGKYDATTNTYRVMWNKTGFECENGYFRIKAYTPFEKNGLCDISGRVVLPFKYDYVDDMNGYNLVVVRNNEDYGVINNDNKVVVPLEYQYIKINENYIRASVDSSGGVFGMKSTAYDFTGNRIFSELWLDYLISLGKKDAYNTYSFLVGVKDSVSYLYFFETKKTLMKTGALYGFYSLNENAKEAYILKAYKSSAGIEPIKYALMDKEGKDLLPYNYDDIKPSVNDVFIVQQKNLFGAYDAKLSDWVLPVNYLKGDISIKLNGNLIGTKYRKRFRYTDRSGTVILSEKNQILNFDNTVVNFIHVNGRAYHLVYDEVKNKFYWYQGIQEL